MALLQFVVWWYKRLSMNNTRSACVFLIALVLGVVGYAVHQIDQRQQTPCRYASLDWIQTQYPQLGKTLTILGKRQAHKLAAHQLKRRTHQAQMDYAITLAKTPAAKRHAQAQGLLRDQRLQAELDALLAWQRTERLNTCRQALPGLYSAPY